MANSQYLMPRIEAVRPLKASNLTHERMGAMLLRLQAQQGQQYRRLQSHSPDTKP